jgi:hypothetical protein
MRRIAPAVFAMILAGGAAGLAHAQTAQGPAPAPNAAPTMTEPEGSVPSIVQRDPSVENPESTVGLAPTEQPVNNIKESVAGIFVPSSQDTAAHNPSIFAHDRQPIITHTFNFTAEQRKAIVDALAQDKGAPQDGGIALQETQVVPQDVELKPVPERIAQEMPWVKPYYYVKSGDRIALINPLGRYVAAVIN